MIGTGTFPSLATMVPTRWLVHRKRVDVGGEEVARADESTLSGSTRGSSDMDRSRADIAFFECLMIFDNPKTIKIRREDVRDYIGIAPTR